VAAAHGFVNPLRSFRPLPQRSRRFCPILKAKKPP